MTKSAKAMVYAFITAVLVVAVAMGCTFTGGDTEVPVDVIAATLPVAAPVEEEPATLRELTEDEIARVNEAFCPTELQADADYTINQFLSSYYDDVREMDLAEFMRYLIAHDELVEDAAEFAALNEKYDLGVASLADMPVPLHKYTSEALDAVLRQYAGVALAELKDVWSDSTELRYLAEYDAYYNTVSDFGVPTFRCTHGEIEGDIVRLYNSDKAILTLRREGERWLIVSHQRLGEPEDTIEAVPESEPEPTPEPTIELSTPTVTQDSVEPVLVHLIPDGETCAFDLNGDGTPEQIVCDWEQGTTFTANYSDCLLNIDGHQLTEELGLSVRMKDPHYAIVDLDTSDQWLELAIPDSGPSADYLTYFYRYDGEMLIPLGHVQGTLGLYNVFGEPEVIVNGDGTITAPFKLPVLQTWWTTTEYGLIDGQLEVLPKEWYEARQYGELPEDEIPEEDLQHYMGRILRINTDVIAHTAVDGEPFTLPAGTYLEPLAVHFSERDWEVIRSDRLYLSSDDYAPWVQFREWETGELVYVQFPRGYGGYEAFENGYHAG